MFRSAKVNEPRSVVTFVAGKIAPVKVIPEAPTVVEADPEMTRSDPEAYRFWNPSWAEHRSVVPPLALASSEPESKIFPFAPIVVEADPDPIRMAPEA